MPVPLDAPVRVVPVPPLVAVVPVCVDPGPPIEPLVMVPAEPVLLPAPWLLPAV